VNILFVNYGDFTTNSLNHIGIFANALIKEGHDCIIAVPNFKESINAIPDPLFTAATYNELLQKPNYFKDGKSADIIHAWTPRELVRTFVIEYQIKAHAKLIIHLEDNEDFLLSAWLKTPLNEIKKVSNLLLSEKGTPALSHPRRARAFMRAADAITYITGSLKEFIPVNLMSMELTPGIDFDLYTTPQRDLSLKKEIGIPESDKVIVFTGSNTFANEADIKELYLAIELLNKRNIPTTLVRTGFVLEDFKRVLPSTAHRHVIELGFVEKTKLPHLLALADVLIQPGKVDPFNKYRLPSKLPEFLSSHRPVILPPTNIGLELVDGRDALFLQEGTAHEIATLCHKLFISPELSQSLADNALNYARKRFNLNQITTSLFNFYKTILEIKSSVEKTSHLAMNQNELTLASRGLVQSLDEGPLKIQAIELSELIEDLVSDQEVNARLIKKLNNDAELSATHIKNLEILIANHVKHNSTQEIQLKAQSKLIADLNDDVLRLENETIKLNETLKHKSEIADQALAKITHLESAITNLNMALSNKSEVADKALSQLEESTQTLISYKNAVLNREQELTVAIEKIQADLALKDRKIASIKNSFSWKISAPLRIFKSDN